MRKYRLLNSFLIICILMPLLTSCSPGNIDGLPTESGAPSPSVSDGAAAEAGDELNESAQHLIAYGIIQENAYTADRYVSRIVAAQMVADVTGLSEEAQDSAYTYPFVDLSGQADQLIGLLYHMNIVEGVSNNYFMEDEICDLSTFLVFLMRAMGCVGGRQEDIARENAVDMAVERGILLSADEANGDGVLSVNEAFDICYEVTPKS